MVKNNMNKKNIAILFSGQKRFINEATDKILKNLIEPLLKLYNVDVFFTVWDSPFGTIFPVFKKEKSFPILLQKENEDYIKNKLPIKLFKHIDEKKCPNDFLNFEIKHPHKQRYVRQFYSLYENFKNVIKYEQENNIEYDIFIKCRTDIFLNTEISIDQIKKLKDDELLVPEVEAHMEIPFDSSIFCNDQIWIIKRKNAKNLFSIFANLNKEVLSDENKIIDVNVERFLHDYVVNYLKSQIKTFSFINDFIPDEIKNQKNIEMIKLKKISPEFIDVFAEGGCLGSIKILNKDLFLVKPNFHLNRLFEIKTKEFSSMQSACSYLIEINKYYFSVI